MAGYAHLDEKKSAEEVVLVLVDYTAEKFPKHECISQPLEIFDAALIRVRDYNKDMGIGDI